MMTVEEIQAELDRLLPMVTAKGIVAPRLSYRLRPAEAPCIEMQWWIGNNFQMKSWPDFPAFIAWVDDLPTPETAALRAHNNRIADVIDKARADNIPDEYVSPLVVVREALSSNLLTVAK